MSSITQYILARSVGAFINTLSYINAEKAKNIAYRFFSQPRKGKLKTTELPKFLKSATQEQFQYNGENFQSYIWKGNENTILLLHGWESNSTRWKKLIRRLHKSESTIISIDAPAHGLSDGIEFNTPKYAAFINTIAQKYKPKTIIGHSMGGITIAYYLRQYNDPTVEKVVLLGAPSEFKILNDNFAKKLGLNKKTKNLLEQFCKEKFNIEIEDFSGHLFAQNFTQKAFIAHDTKDDVVLIEEGRKYSNTWKDATFIETTGLGHSMHSRYLYHQIISFIESK